MKTVALVYYSKSGQTKQLAKAIAKGLMAQAPIALVEHQISDTDIINGRFINPALFATLEHCDAIVMGTPTYMGSVSAQFKTFADASSDVWTTQGWANKLAAGFTCGSSPNGDQSSTLQYLATLASQHGMLWLGLDTPLGYGDHQVNRLGCQLGVVACSQQDNISQQDLDTAFYLGKRIAKLTCAFNLIDDN